MVGHHVLTKRRCDYAANFLASHQFGGNFGGNFAAGIRGMMAQEMMDGRFAARPEHYDEFFKAYSMAMLPGKERTQVSYGGKSECEAQIWYGLRWSGRLLNA